MRVSPVLSSFGDDGADPVYVPSFINGYEASQFYQEQRETHCRIARVRFKGSGCVWHLSAPRLPVPSARYVVMPSVARIVGDPNAVISVKVNE